MAQLTPIPDNIKIRKLEPEGPQRGSGKTRYKKCELKPDKSQWAKWRKQK